MTVMAEGLDAPAGLAARDGELLRRRSRHEARCCTIAKAGTAVTPPAVVASGLDGPEGLAAAADGLVVMEAGRGRVTWLATDGTTKTLGDDVAGSPAGIEAQPPSMVFNGVAVAPDGTIYVTDEQHRGLFKISR